jgi:ribonuclease III
MSNIQKFEKHIKIKFKNKFLLIEALTHKSANQKINNEKLEFLGDRVLGLVLSKKLYDLYPIENEGVLDKKLASLVKRKTCSDIAWSIGMQNYIITGSQKKKVLINDEKILSDSCEAIIGAIFLDRGFDTAKNYILKIWKKKIDKSNITILDPKTKLQEYSLKKYKKLPNYRIVNSTGPRHNPTYKISVSITNSKEYTGSGNSKQMAELDAASKLLKDKNIN